MSERPYTYTPQENVNENVSKLNAPTNEGEVNVDRPYRYQSTTEVNITQAEDTSGLTNVSNQRPSTLDEILSLQGDLLLVDIESSLFNYELGTILMPIDLSSVFHNAIRITFKKKDINSSFGDSGLQYSYTYFVKELNSSTSVIELYYDKNLTNKVVFTSDLFGTHQLAVRVNPFKFQSETLLPYARMIEDLNAQFTDILNHLVQLESDDPDSFEKILQDISSKYVSYFDLGDDVITELINESGYSYLTDIGINLNTTELSSFYSYLKLFHMLKGSRQGLELILQLLGYESKLVEWWEMPNLSVLPIGEPATFDIIIKIVDQPTLTLQQGNKIRVFTRYYVYPLLRYIIQDILLQFVSLGVSSAGFGDKIFEVDALFNTLVVSGGGHTDTVFDLDLLNPSFNSEVPFHFDNVEGYSGYLTLGQTYDYLVLDSVTTTGISIYLTNASVVGNVAFSLKKNGTLLIPQINLTLVPTQNTHSFLISTSFVQGDVLTLTVESLNVLDTSVGNSLVYGFF